MTRIKSSDARKKDSLFSEFRGIRHEIRLLRRELCELELIKSALEKAEENDDPRINVLLGQIRRRADALTDKYENFERFISEVGDSFDRTALTLRYLYGMTWIRVAFALGEHDEQYARRRCEKYTKRAKKLFLP